MMRASITAFSLSLLAVSSCSQHEGQTSDFELLCRDFTQLTEQSRYEFMSSSERADLLESKLAESLTPDQSAYIAWTAIRNADPAERYNLYQDAAASSGHDGWDCLAMRMHSHEVGSPFK